MSSKISEFSDLSGKCLFVWYFYQTYKYILSGRLVAEVTNVSATFSANAIWVGIFSIFQIPISTMGIFIFIPLLFRGNKWGLILGIAYWIMGSLINPLWFLMTNKMQMTSEGEATVLLHVANSVWAIITFFILISFYINRKKQIVPSV